MKKPVLFLGFSCRWSLLKSTQEIIGISVMPREGVKQGTAMVLGSLMVILCMRTAAGFWSHAPLLGPVGIGRGNVALLKRVGAGSWRPSVLVKRLSCPGILSELRMARWEDRNEDNDGFEYGELDFSKKITLPARPTPRGGRGGREFVERRERDGGAGMRRVFDRGGSMSRERGRVKKPAYIPDVGARGVQLEGSKLGSVDWVSPASVAGQREQLKVGQDGKGGKKHQRNNRGSINNPRDVAYDVLSVREGGGGGFVERVLDAKLFTRPCVMSSSDKALCRC